MFVLSQDRLNMDLDRESLELMLNLLESDASHKLVLINTVVFIVLYRRKSAMEWLGIIKLIWCYLRWSTDAITHKKCLMPSGANKLLTSHVMTWQTHNDSVIDELWYVYSTDRIHTRVNTLARGVRNVFAILFAPYAGRLFINIILFYKCVVCIICTCVFMVE